MLGIEMMDKNSGNEGGAIVNIASLSGESMIFSISVCFNIVRHA